MTLPDFVTKYNGRKVGDGQCGNLVRQYWIEVDHTSPPSYPDSKDYWFNPVPGYTKTANPQPGDIAIYNGHGAYPEGHSAIYIGNEQVFEQNADPDGAPAHIFSRANTYLLGYLSKGDTMGDLETLTGIASARHDMLNELWNAAGVDPAKVTDEQAATNQAIANIDAKNKAAQALTVLKPGNYKVN